MTAQIEEKILYKGENYRMTSLPFSNYLKTLKDIKLEMFNTANYRGYFGSWKLKDNKLFLIDLHANVAGTKGVELDYFFPGQTEVFARWFSGEVELQSGEMLEYVHQGFDSVFDKEIHLTFKKGKLIDEREVDNREKYMSVSEQGAKKSWRSQLLGFFKR